MNTFDIAPSQTLYVNNLNDKVKKNQLKRSLYHIFSQFGSIMDIVALKTTRMRGQAWIVFEDIAAATNALRSLQGFPFYDKAMRLAYAKAKSRAVEMQEGSYKKKKRKLQKKQHIGPPLPKEAEPSVSKAASAPLALTNGAPRSMTIEDAGPKSRMIMCKDLPERCNEMMLSTLFKQFSGLQDIRLISGKRMAFIEYGNEDEAEVAMKALQNFRLSQSENLHLSYAK